jgi:hypothetical protein
VKTSTRGKVPFGTARMIGIAHARYLAWKGAIEVEFEDGVVILEANATIKKANGISSRAMPIEVKVDRESRLGLKIRYHTGEEAEVSWGFIRELPPKKPAPRNGAKKHPRQPGSAALSVAK